MTTLKSRLAGLLRGIVPCALACSAFAATASHAQTIWLTAYEKTYGTANSLETTQRSHPLERTKDNGYIMVGTTGATGSQERIYAVKVSANGYVMWSKTYGITQPRLMQGNDVHPTKDGGYIILGTYQPDFTVSTGNSSAGPVRTLVLKVDGTGNLQWSKELSIGGSSTFGGAIIETSDGGYAVTAELHDAISIIKLRKDGTEEWTRWFAINNAVGRDIQQTADGGYIVVGSEDGGNPTQDVCVVKVASDGTKQWSRVFGGSTHDEIAHAVRQTSNGEYVIAGSGGSDMYVIRINNSGNLIWSKLYDAGSGADIAYDVKEGQAGELYIAGQVNGNRGALVCLNSSGVVTWGRTYGLNTVLRSVIPISTGFQLCGEKYVPATPVTVSDLYLLRADATGATGCDTDPLTLTPTIVTHQSDPSFVFGHGIAVTKMNPNAATPTTVTDVLCFVKDGDKPVDVGIPDFNVARGIKFPVVDPPVDPPVVVNPWQEPIAVNWGIWQTEFIWVRNEQDDPVGTRGTGTIYAHERQHQEPIYQGPTPNYIYVEVTNHGHETSSPGTLVLYWTRTSTNIEWNTHWDNYMAEGSLQGDVAGEVTIPALEPGEMYVAEIPWIAPDPASFGETELNLSFLARYESLDDPMTFPEVASTNTNAINNNNIAWKNVMVVTPEDMSQESGGLTSKTILVRNTSSGSTLTDLTFEIPDEERGGWNPLLERAVTTVTLDAVLYARWLEGGGVGYGFDDNGDGTFTIVEEEAAFQNINLEGESEQSVGITFEFVGPALDFPQYYHYDVIQSGGLGGGLTFELNFPTVGDEENPPKRAYPGKEEYSGLAGVMMDARPNPTKSSTVIAYTLPSEMRGQLSIYDIAGQLVRLLVPERDIAAGKHTVQWDGNDAAGAPVASGLYIYRLETSAGVLNRQLRIVR